MNSSLNIIGLGSGDLELALDHYRSKNSDYVRQDKSLDDQLTELNNLTKDNIIWEMNGEKIVPKSINVFRSIKSKFSKSLVFNRIKIEHYDSIYKKSFTLHKNSETYTQKEYLPEKYIKGMIVAIADQVVLESFDLDGKGYNDYSGWYLCDGRNGAPDLRGRFLVGHDSQYIDYNQIGKTGGLNKYELTLDELPAHNHYDTGHSHKINIKTTNNGAHYHTIDDKYTKCCNRGHDHSVSGSYSYEVTRTVYSSENGEHYHKVEGNVETAKSTLSFTGQNKEHENRPPYYVVSYIIYLK